MPENPSPRTRLTAADFDLPESVPCPFCDRGETELHNPFGGQISVSTYWCRRCRSAFEWFRREPRSEST